MIQKIKNNFFQIVKQWIVIIGTLFSVFSALLVFVTWEEMGVTKIFFKICIFLIVIVFGFLVSVIWICFCKKSNQIWSQGNGKINVTYGNILKIAFPKKSKGKRIVVIPVNTCFDTIVDENLSMCDKPLVSAKTIHGMWIREMEKRGTNIELLDKKIEEYIQTKAIEYIKKLAKENKPRGKRKVFDFGTVVVLEEKNDVIFFLLSISEFDIDNKAQSSKEKIIKSLKSLLSFYDSNGQGYTLYLPLMGTGRARAGLTHKESLQTIKAVLLLYNEVIKGEINIVVYDKDSDKVSIFD